MSSPVPHLDRLLRARDGIRAVDLVRDLCDTVGPRYPCTPGDAAAVAWAKAALRDAGLSDARAEPATATLWERGTESCVLHLPRAAPVVLSALGGSVGTPAGGIEAEVLEFLSLDALAAATRDQVAGKIVYVHHVMPRLRDGTGYNAAHMVRAAAPSRASKKGAIACLVRSAGTDATRAAHTGAVFYDPDAPPIPAAALSTPDADLLHRSIARGKPVTASLTLGCTPMPVGTSANVLAELSGGAQKDEIVLLGAHLDSWDLGTGALDDGAGCAIAIDAARLLAELPEKPRRTVRIALFANEELGSGGGLAYAAAHAAEASRHVAALEADQGDGKPWALRVPASGRDTRLTQALSSALQPFDIELDAGPSRGGVDIQPLRHLGVPFVDLRQDATRYFDFHHTVNDVFENVSPADLRDATLAFAVAVWVIANADDRYP